jgi:restriction system protein
MRAVDPYRDSPRNLQTWSFPTDALLGEFLRGVQERDLDEIMHLLRWFLFDAGSFGGDRENTQWLVRRMKADGKPPQSEYERRLMRGIGRNIPAQPGIRWVLDLLPLSPRLALDTIGAYTQAHGAGLPDGRLQGLADAEALIRAFFIGRHTSDGRSALLSISPREFEVLTARLYTELGYVTELTRPGSDGGRDVVARMTDSGRQHVTLVECKHHSSRIGVRYVRALLGAVAHERANSGVLVASGDFTRGAIALAQADSRVEVVDGTTLCKLLNEHFSADWPARLDWLLRESKGPS